MQERRIGKYWLHYGRLRGIALGLRIDRFGWDIDLIKFFIGIEK
jgi:hypothetical protein